jgi:hypothetical protein
MRLSGFRLKSVQFDIDTRRVIDVLESRESADVALWLGT